MSGQSRQQGQSTQQTASPGVTGVQPEQPAGDMGNAAMAEQVAGGVSPEQEQQEAVDAQRSANDDLLVRHLYLDFGYRVDETHPLTPQLRQMMSGYLETMAREFGSVQARLPAELTSLVLNVYPHIVQPDQFTGNHVYGIRFGALWRDITQHDALSGVLEQEDLDEVREHFEEKYMPPDVDQALFDATVGMIPGQAGYGATIATAEDAGAAIEGVASRALGDALPMVGLVRDLGGMVFDLAEQRELREWADGGSGPTEDIRTRLDQRVARAQQPGARRNSQLRGSTRTAWEAIRGYLALFHGHTVRDERRATMSAG